MKSDNDNPLDEEEFDDKEELKDEEEPIIKNV